jgi:hypothetical protein
MEVFHDEDQNMTVGQLRAWLLNMHTHSNIELLRVFRQCYYNEVEGATPGENRIIDQVLKIYNIAGDLPFARVMVNVLSTFQMSNLRWDFATADWRLTCHILKRFLEHNQHLLPNLDREEAPVGVDAGRGDDNVRDISHGNNSDNNNNVNNNNINNNNNVNNNNDNNNKLLMSSSNLLFSVIVIKFNNNNNNNVNNNNNNNNNNVNNNNNNVNNNLMMMLLKVSV